MRIGLDIDGVCYEWSKTARYMLREIYPGELSDDQKLALTRESTSWNYIQGIVGNEAFGWLWSEGVRLGLFRYGHLVRGAVKGVRLLAQDHEVIAVTHRPSNAVEDTLAWLSFMQLPLKGIHIFTNQESKLIADCDAYIDDKPETIEEVVRGGRYGILFDREWNRDCMMGYRAHGWDDVTSTAIQVAESWVKSELYKKQTALYVTGGAV